MAAPPAARFEPMLGGHEQHRPTEYGAWIELGCASTDPQLSAESAL